jgi:hypothetical protein
METILNVQLLEDIDAFAENWADLPLGVAPNDITALNNLAASQGKDKAGRILATTYDALATMGTPYAKAAFGKLAAAVSVVMVDGNVAKVEELYVSPEAVQLLRAKSGGAGTNLVETKMVAGLQEQNATLLAQLKELEKTSSEQIGALQNRLKSAVATKPLAIAPVPGPSPIKVNIGISRLRNLQQEMLRQRGDLGTNEAGAYWTILGDSVQSVIDLLASPKEETAPAAMPAA